MDAIWWFGAIVGGGFAIAGALWTLSFAFQAALSRAAIWPLVWRFFLSEIKSAADRKKNAIIG